MGVQIQTLIDSLIIYINQYDVMNYYTFYFFTYSQDESFYKKCFFFYGNYDWKKLRILENSFHLYLNHPSVYLHVNSIEPLFKYTLSSLKKLNSSYTCRSLQNSEFYSSSEDYLFLKRFVFSLFEKRLTNFNLSQIKIKMTKDC